MLRRTLLALLFACLPLGDAWAVNCSSNPFTLTNNQQADATQVMSNFNNLLNCANNNLAHNGANSDITSLSALATPLSTSQGGSGVASPTANNVLLGNGASAFQLVAPSTSGNVLKSDGTTWASSVPLSSVATSGLATGGPITATGTVNVSAADVSTTITGTSTTTALTPGGFAGTKLLSGNGYYRFPGGLLIEWGSLNIAANTTVTGSFPLAFPGAPFSFVVSVTSLGNSTGWAGTSISNSQFQIKNPDASSTLGFSWIAIGD
jgi:hypothetical protein